WTPVRLLHPGNDDVFRRVAPEESASDGGADPPSDFREPVPLHRVREYREGDPARREEHGRTFGRRTTMTVHGGIGQSVKRKEDAAVGADSRYAAADGVAAVEVEYEPLPVVVDPKKALEPDAPILRPDRKEQTNRIWHWEVGDRAGTEKALKESDVVVHEDLYIPRIHVSSIETCGCVASFDAMGKLTVWMTTQAPHAIRTVFALVAGLPEQKI